MNKRLAIQALIFSIFFMLIFPSFVEATNDKTGEQNNHSWQQLSPNVRIGGSTRYRYEAKQDFQFGTATAANSQDYWLQQLRLHMAWQPSASISLFVEAQDARIFQGVHGHVINNRKTPNIFEDHLDVHQAYVDITIDGNNAKSRLRIGR